MRVSGYVIVWWRLQDLWWQHDPIQHQKTNAWEGPLTEERKPQAASSMPGRTQGTTSWRVIFFSTNAIGTSDKLGHEDTGLWILLMTHNCYSYSNVMKKGQWYHNRITIMEPLCHWRCCTEFNQHSPGLLHICEISGRGKSRTERLAVLPEGSRQKESSQTLALSISNLTRFIFLSDPLPAVSSQHEEKCFIKTLPNPLFIFQVQLKPHHFLCQSLHPTSHLCCLL